MSSRSAETALGTAGAITSVLIANRGEIAVRIARTLRRLGIESIGVYAPVDAGAPHTRAVDRTVALIDSDGGSLAPYLDIAAIVAAAERSGAKAIHPGYGFLAESAEAAAACERAGLIWIGPTSEAIARVGDKAEAKRLAEGAGVPIVPGISEEPQAAGQSGAGRTTLNPAAVAEFAARHGYPVMIKAGAGGGGKGMRRVGSEAEIAPALEAARREAGVAFGAGHLLVEKLIEPARHIEVQFAVDAAGRAIALGERECSLQRRHQKLIEEAPSPAVSPELRERLGRAAVRLAEAAGYRNLGTAEFLVDFDDPSNFFFLEINARLQVEHPVTEAVAGLDLVELQLELAEGRELAEDLAQVAERLQGHAIEARICAERPAAGFMPAIGRIATYREPGGVRIDSGVEEGSVVTTDFDPMLAKVIAHAPTREEAVAKLRAALAGTVTLGVETNAGFLDWLLAQPAMRDGATTITTVEGLIESGAYAQALREAEPAALAACALACANSVQQDEGERAGEHSGVGEGFDRADGWRLSGRGRGVWRVKAEDGAIHTVAARPSANGFELSIDGRPQDRAEFASLTAWRVTPERVEVQGEFGRANYEFLRELSVDAAPAGSLEASLPGVVLDVAVSEGDEVEPGQTLLTVESMKMEIAITAPEAGRVAAISVTAGDHVARGQLLAELETREGAV